MDILAQIMSEKYSNPIEFLNQLRQTTESIGGGMEYSDNGEYVEYDVAVEAVKKAQKQLIDKACERLEDYFAPDGSMVPENIRLWRDLQRVIKGE